MESAKDFFRNKIVPGLHALIFVIALLLLSALLIRRHIHF